MVRSGVERAHLGAALFLALACLSCGSSAPLAAGRVARLWERTGLSRGLLRQPLRRLRGGASGGGAQWELVGGEDVSGSREGSVHREVLEGGHREVPEGGVPDGVLQTPASGDVEAHGEQEGSFQVAEHEPGSRPRELAAEPQCCARACIAPEAPPPANHSLPVPVPAERQAHGAGRARARALPRCQLHLHGACARARAATPRSAVLAAARRASACATSPARRAPQVRCVKLALEAQSNATADRLRLIFLGPAARRPPPPDAARRPTPPAARRASIRAPRPWALGAVRASRRRAARQDTSCATARGCRTTRGFSLGTRQCTCAPPAPQRPALPASRAVQVASAKHCGRRRWRCGARRRSGRSLQRMRARAGNGSGAAGRGEGGATCCAW